jgi:peptidoglycan lytic transglycosylase
MERIPFGAPHKFHNIPAPSPFGSDQIEPNHHSPQQLRRLIMAGNSLPKLVAALILVASTIVMPMTASAQSGIASIYSGGRTANGERAAASGLTAAHRTLPFGTHVLVTNRRTGRSVVVRINDRGPFIRGRIIDVTPAAAHALGFSGLAPVTVAVVGGN